MWMAAAGVQAASTVVQMTTHRKCSVTLRVSDGPVRLAAKHRVTRSAEGRDMNSWSRGCSSCQCRRTAGQHLEEGDVVGGVLGDGCQYAIALPEHQAVKHLRWNLVFVPPHHTMSPSSLTPFLTSTPDALSADRRMSFARGGRAKNRCCQPDKLTLCKLSDASLRAKATPPAASTCCQATVALVLIAISSGRQLRSAASAVYGRCIASASRRTVSYLQSSDAP
jgi:hypothetical protein